MRTHVSALLEANSKNSHPFIPEKITTASRETIMTPAAVGMQTLRQHFALACGSQRQM
jgi:hypothetical protein